RILPYTQANPQISPDARNAPVSDSTTDAQRGLSAPQTRNVAMPGSSGTTPDSAIPNTVPPSVNSSGRIRSSKSVAINAIRIALSTEYFAAGQVNPNFATHNEKAAAVASSTSG